MPPRPVKPASVSTSDTCFAMPPVQLRELTLLFGGYEAVGLTIPILALGSVLGRVNFKAWIPYVLIWITAVYVVNAFLIWGGGYWAAHGALDYSGGYVIHLAAGVSGFSGTSGMASCALRASAKTSLSSTKDSSSSTAWFATIACSMTSSGAPRSMCWRRLRMNWQ